VACGTYVGEQKYLQYVWGGGAGTEGRNHLGDLDVDGGILLKFIWKEQKGITWIMMLWLRTGVSGGCLCTG
jgi:hypothetical protein